MADYTVRFAAQDDMSKTINDIDKSLEGMNEAANKTAESLKKFDSFSEEFNDISTNSKSLKSELRQLQTLIAKMSLEDGFDDKGLMLQAAQRAGEIKDAIDDASQSVRAFASDTSSLDAGLQAFQFGAAGASVFAGALGMLGVESKKTNEMILKVQSAIAILNGAQQIANVLNKDSALMLKIKAIALKATAESQTKLTATEVTGTVAEKGLTTATKAGTIAKGAEKIANVAGTASQNAWNVAKAIGKAMLGDFTGLLLLGVGAITTYSMATSLLADEEDERTKALEREKEAQKSFNSSYAESIDKLVGGYNRLRESYVQMRTEADKRQWLIDNRDAQNELGYAVRDTVEADDLYINKTKDVIRALELRAKAAAYAAIAQKKLEMAMEEITNKFHAGQDVDYGDAEEMLGKEWRKYTEEYFGKNWLGMTISKQRISEEGMLLKIEETYEQTERSIHFLRKKNEDLIKEAEKIEAANGVSRTKQKPQAGSANDLRQQRQDLQLQFDNTNDEKLKKELAKKIAKLDKQIQKSSPKVGAKVDKPLVEGSLAWIQNEIKKLDTAIQNGSKAWNDETKAMYKNLRQMEKQKKYELGLGFKPGSLADIQNDISELEKELKNGLVADADVDEAKRTLKELKAQAEKEEIRIGVKVVAQEGSLTDLKDKLSKMKKEYEETNWETTLEMTMAYAEIEKLEKKILVLDATVNPQKLKALGEEFNKIEFKPKVSSYNKAIGVKKPETYDEVANSVQQQMDYNDRLIEQLEELKKKYEELGTAGATGVEEITNKINAVNQEQTELGETAKNVEENRKKWEQTQNTLNAAADIASSTGSAFGSLGQAFSAAGDEEAAAVMNMVQTTLDGVATVIPQILALIGAKEGEAMASGTASAAKLPYPANLAAIASVIATVISVFASIASTMSAFATGGIVGGSAAEHPILAHSGEIVLNERQQKNLFEAIDKNRIGGGNNITGVVGRVRGKDLELVLDNVKRSKKSAGLSLSF